MKNNTSYGVCSFKTNGSLDASISVPVLEAACSHPAALVLCVLALYAETIKAAKPQVSGDKEVFWQLLEWGDWLLRHIAHR